MRSRILDERLEARGAGRRSGVSVTGGFPDEELHHLADVDHRRNAGVVGVEGHALELEVLRRLLGEVDAATDRVERLVAQLVPQRLGLGDGEVAVRDGRLVVGVGLGPGLLVVDVRLGANARDGDLVLRAHGLQLLVTVAAQLLLGRLDLRRLRLGLPALVLHQPLALGELELLVGQLLGLQLRLVGLLETDGADEDLLGLEEVLGEHDPQRRQRAGRDLEPLLGAEDLLGGELRELLAHRALDGVDRQASVLLGVALTDDLVRLAVDHLVGDGQVVAGEVAVLGPDLQRLARRSDAVPAVDRREGHEVRPPVDHVPLVHAGDAKRETRARVALGHAACDEVLLDPVRPRMDPDEEGGEDDESDEREPDDRHEDLGEAFHRDSPPETAGMVSSVGLSPLCSSRSGAGSRL